MKESEQTPTNNVLITLSIFAHSKFASSQIKIEPQTRRYNLIQCYRCFFINKEYFARQDFTLTGIDPEKTTFTINHKCLVRLSHVKPNEASSRCTLLLFPKTSSFNCKLNPSFFTFCKNLNGILYVQYESFSIFENIRIFSRLFHL